MRSILEKSYTKLAFLIILTIVSCQSIQPQLLTNKIYTEHILTELNNIHHFIITSSSIMTKQFIDLINKYKQNYSIQLYICNPIDQKDICPIELQIVLFINTVKIQYNGQRGKNQDVLKWFKFRMDEYPKRLHSIQELRQYVKGKNQVFCFVDKQGQAITQKEYIFIATAKKLHFLHYCSLDVSIAQPIGLKQSHLALIRKDLSFNFDYWSFNKEYENHQLHLVWLNFLTKSCQSDFRIQNRDKTHDLVYIQCDFSLKCQEQLYTILLSQLIWRVKHPEMNFKLKLLSGTTGNLKKGKKIIQKYPALKYGKTFVSKQIIHQQSGAVLEQTKYWRDLYQMDDPTFDENTIDKLLQSYNAKNLAYIIQESSIDIRPLHPQQAQGHRQAYRKQQQQKKYQPNQNSQQL